MKKVFRLLGFTVMAVIVLSVMACDQASVDKVNDWLDDHELDGVDIKGKAWVSISQGNEYTPIEIPDILWLGDEREIGGNFGFINTNVVKTIRKANGAFAYTLNNKTGGDPYDLFNVLWIKPMENPITGTGKPITSANKSGNDHPGILFMWDRTRDIKDNYYESVYLQGLVDDGTLSPDTVIPDKYDNYYPGMLKVHETVFQKYIGFVLRIKSDYYLIIPQRGQLRNVGEDGQECDSYVFYIDVDDYTIGDGDVYIQGYIETETPDVTPPRPDPPPPPEPPIDPPEEDPNEGDVPVKSDDPPDPPPPPPEPDDPFDTPVIVTPTEKNGNKYVIISIASEQGAEVDPNNQWKFSGKPIKNFWDDVIQSNTPIPYEQMTGIKNSEGKRATWIWDREDSWVYGVSGCYTVITASRFYIPEDEEIADFTIPFYFACDNAAAVYVNGALAGSTTRPFDNGRLTPGPTSDWRFTGLDNSDFNGELWGYLYVVNIKSLMKQGHNEILIMAANNDESGGRWNDTNNPAGLLFACEFSTRAK